MQRSEPTAAQGRAFWSIAAAVVLADAFTKIVAVDALSPVYLPRRVIGEAVRFTLVYNPGAAFGLHLEAVEDDFLQPFRQFRPDGPWGHRFNVQPPAQAAHAEG